MARYWEQHFKHDIDHGKRGVSSSRDNIFLTDARKKNLSDSYCTIKWDFDNAWLHRKGLCDLPVYGIPGTFTWYGYTINVVYYHAAPGGVSSRMHILGENGKVAKYIRPAGFAPIRVKQAMDVLKAYCKQKQTGK